MAGSEAALSLVIIRLDDLLSKSKDFTLYQKLRHHISPFIDNLQTILNTRKDGHNKETQEGEEQLLRLARRAEQIAEEFFVRFCLHQMSKSQQGRFTKVFDLVRFFPVMNRARAREKMTKSFLREIRLLSSKFAPSCSPAKKAMPENERPSSSSSSERNRESTRPRVESDIVGRDPDVKDLLARLINDEDSSLRVISVVGEKAWGKTALVRSVFGRPEIKHHFDCCTWVRVTGLGNRLGNLLVDILKQTPLGDQAKDLEHKQEEQLFDMLHKSLMGIRYLIVLDNLHEASLINDLLFPFVDSMNGSRVIVTTRNAEMQKFADPWTPHLQLSPDLPCRECWEDLQQASIMGGGDPVDRESKMTIFKERILSKCNGPPPVISLLGGLLPTVGVSNWETLINQLGDRPTLDNVLHLSFDQLTHMMKLRVLYMALFPEEFEIPTRRLLPLWAAEGLLAEAAADGSITMQSADDCFRELESRNLICVVRRSLDGSARSCRVPAFIHEFLFRKAKELRLLETNCVFDAEQSAQSQQKQEQKTATGHYGYKVQCLRSFALFDTRKLGTKAKITVLLKSSILGAPLILLRVLDLEGVYKPVLPENFGNTLLSLRYLGLRWTALEFLPESVGNLLLLETLDLKHTNITKVTSSIWNAENLRHLYLSEASLDKYAQRQISSGKSPNTKLETLWGLFIETADSPMIHVLEKLGGLKKLGVTCCPGAVKAVTDCVSKLVRLKSLRLRSRDLYGQPLQALRLRSRDLLGQPATLHLSDMTGAKPLSNLYLLGSLRPVQKPNLSSVLPRNLTALTLSMSELEEDPMQVLRDLKGLIILRLLARSYINTTLSCRKGDFPRLRVLKLWMLENLEGFEVKNGGMSNLEELEIRQCQRLASVNGLYHINSLKSVILTGVDGGRMGHIGVSRHTLVKPKERFGIIVVHPY